MECGSELNSKRERAERDTQRIGLDVKGELSREVKKMQLYSILLQIRRDSKTSEARRETVPLYNARANTNSNKRQGPVAKAESNLGHSIKMGPTVLL